MYGQGWKEMQTGGFLKLEIYIPETYLKDLQSALIETDAGHIGNYDCCLSYYPVMSTWRPLSGTNPYSGTIGEISCEQELKVEVTIHEGQLEAVMKAVRRVHPYEEPVVNVVPLYYTMRDCINSDIEDSDKDL